MECKYKDCVDRPYARGFCRKHYDKLRRSSSTSDFERLKEEKTINELRVKVRKKEDMCTYEGCKNLKRYRGFCDKHYWKIRRYELGYNEAPPKYHLKYYNRTHSRAKRVRCIDTGKVYGSMKEAAEDNFISYAYMRNNALWNRENNKRTINGIRFERIE